MGIEWRLDQLLSGSREWALVGLGAAGALLAIGLVWLVRRLARRKRRSARAVVTDMDVLAETIAMRVAAHGRGQSGAMAGMAPVGVISPRTAASSAMRVMLFIDYPNFLRNFRNRARATGLGDPRLDWPGLPRLVMDEIAALGVWPASDLRFVTAHVYDSYIPFEVLSRHGVSLEEAHQNYGYQGRAFLLDTLALLPGYEVHIFDRVLRYEHGGAPQRNGDTGQLASGEKGVDTSLVADMIALAATGALDIAVVLSDDTDCIPAIETLQLRLGIPVIQMGFSQRGTARRAAWRHITVDRRTIERLAQASRLTAPIRMLRRGMSGKSGVSPHVPASPSPSTHAKPSPAPTAPQAPRSQPPPAKQSAAPQPSTNPASETVLTVGSVHEATVLNVKLFGVFVEVTTPAGPVKGLIHRSQIDLPRDMRLRDAFGTGKRVRIKVMEPDPHGRRQFTVRGVAQEPPMQSPAAPVAPTTPAMDIPPAAPVAKPQTEADATPVAAVSS